MEKNNQVVCLNHGSYNIKAGFAGDNAPRSVFPSIVGRPKYKFVMIGANNKDSYVGDEIKSKRSFLSFRYVIKNGIIDNWDDYEKLIYHAYYNELRVEPEKYPVFVNEFARNPKIQSQKIGQILFETFNVPALHLNDFCQSILTSIDRNSTAIVVHIGDGISIVEPFINGNGIIENVQKQNIAGYELNLFLRKLMYSEAVNLPILNESSDIGLVQDIKEKLCYVALDFDKEMEKSRKENLSKSYELPDYQTVSLSQSRFICPELLFQPKMQDWNYHPIHKLVSDSILKCDPQYHQLLFQNIILSGGSTLFQGFPERLKKELELSTQNQVNIVSLENRNFLNWIGSSKIAKEFTKFYTMDDYNENGEIPTFQDYSKTSEMENDFYIQFEKEIPSQSEMGNGNAIVIDQGSNSIKAGFSGEMSPKIKLPNLIGTNRKKINYIGNDAISKKELRIEYPIENGRVKNWDQLEKIYHHLLFSELKMESANEPVLIAEPMFASKPEREKLVELFLETFSFPSIAFEIQPLLTLLALNRRTGLVVDIGDGLTQILPVYEGKFSTNYKLDFFQFGGKSLTQYLVKQLKQAGHYFSSTSEFEIVKQIKEELCYVALDYEEELMISRESSRCEKNFKIGEEIITLNSERFSTPEVLFQPNLSFVEQKGIQETIYEIVELFEPKIQNILSLNIILSGGSTMFPGFEERLKRDLGYYFPQNQNILISSQTNNDILSWIGGSKFTNGEEFLKRSLKRNEYEEYGSKRIHFLCDNF
ncbi:actin-10-related [Anaeramoeba ignava]|uniref:Actin-10-related n=1 Tax=Anaeramoeba ignava TaxID=1746090 RepID=A0A9Q0LLD9_ANAIG|nr:actin-10-related [Anaeramoeba ignava]